VARGIENRSVRVGYFSGHLAGEYERPLAYYLRSESLSAGIRHRIVR
jgi:hypothetical protein